ncbi:MAG: hypothetical protein L0346_00075 [Chloroflexi bacterium]|nr:hypothetical protein [Chloroflexota bacterium]
MSTISTSTPYRTTNLLPALWQRLWGTNRLLALSVVLYFALFAGTLVASIVDTRLVTGAPVWFKPMKFAISAMLYCGTLVWMLGFVHGRRWLVRLIGGATTVALFVEIAIIVFQAARGVRSHFNFTTPLDGTLFSIMGSFIIVIWTMNLLAAVLLLRQRLPDAALAWSLRLGLLITFVGAGTGYFMVRPTPDQLAGLQSGQPPTFIGAHSVGVEDSGPGLPFTGWSTEGGDVRVAHFVGFHALQALPLIGLLVNRRWQHKLSQRRRAALVWTAGLGYLGLVLLLLWQALRGQPLVAPDATTLLALAGLVVGVLVTAVAIIRD